MKVVYQVGLTVLGVGQNNYELGKARCFVVEENNQIFLR
jgi:hypothetical protein